MNARLAVVGLASFSLTGCLLLPDFTHWNGYMNQAELAGRSLAEVLGELGPPAALRDNGSVLLYALPDNNWILVISGYFAGAAYQLDPHWDVRFVGFDSHGVVQVATPKRNRYVTLDELVDELVIGSWRR